MGRAPSTLALRVGGLVVCAFSFTIAGLVLAGVASKPTWHNVVFPPTHGASMLPKVAILSNAAPGWVVVLLVAGFGVLWAGCGWWPFATRRRRRPVDEGSGPGERQE